MSVLVALQDGAAPITGTGSTAQTVQATVAVGLLRLAGVGAESQAAQTAAGTGKESFRASGVTSQQPQASAGIGKLRLVGTGASAQAPQTTSAIGGQGFTGAGSSSQATQAASGAAILRFPGSAATAQQPQTTFGAGGMGLFLVGDTTQAPDTTAGLGTSPVVEGPSPHGPPRGAALITGPAARRRRVYRGRGSTVQVHQRSSGSGFVTDIEALILLEVA